MSRLSLREALALGQLGIFVRDQQDNGAELIAGSELERGLALLVTQDRIAKEQSLVEQQGIGTEVVE